MDDRHIVPLTLLAQVGISSGSAGLLWWAHGNVVAISMLLGGLAAAAPNAFLAARLADPRAGTTAHALLRAAWIGEIGKLLLTMLLFTGIFALVRPVSAPAVFAGFIVAQMVVFAAGLITGRARRSIAKS